MRFVGVDTGEVKFFVWFLVWSEFFLAGEERAQVGYQMVMSQRFKVSLETKSNESFIKFHNL
jgi:hypothetical protein